MQSPFLQPTTLWDFPSQNYKGPAQGDTAYVGATPSYIIWNLIKKYTSSKRDLVIDPFCGSGTTIDVARQLDRKVLGYDLNPTRKDIFKADARELPLEGAKAELVFMDPPYSDHINYSSNPNCIGKLSVFQEKYFIEMRKVFVEAKRILKENGHIAVYVCDFYQNKKGFCPVGFRLFEYLSKLFKPVDIISVTRHNKDLLKGNYLQSAVEENFYLRGFNYLFILKNETTKELTHKQPPFKSKKKFKGSKKTFKGRR